MPLYVSWGGGTKVRSQSLSLSPSLPLPVCRVRGELKVQTANWMCPKGSGPPPPAPPLPTTTTTRKEEEEGEKQRKKQQISRLFIWEKMKDNGWEKHALSLYLFENSTPCENLRWIFVQLKDTMISLNLADKQKGR